MSIPTVDATAASAIPLKERLSRDFLRNALEAHLSDFVNAFSETHSLNVSIAEHSSPIGADGKIVKVPLDQSVVDAVTLNSHLLSQYAYGKARVYLEEADDSKYEYEEFVPMVANSLVDVLTEHVDSVQTGTTNPYTNCFLTWSISKLVVEESQSSDDASSVEAEFSCWVLCRVTLYDPKEPVQCPASLTNYYDQEEEELAYDVEEVDISAFL